MIILNPYRYAAAGGGGGGHSFAAKVMTSATTNLTSYASASYTPTANALLICTVVSNKGSATADTPTLSGNGLTWVQINTTTFDSGLKRVTMFRAMGASPTTGAVTADFGGVSQTGCHICVVEFTGVNTGGSNGSAAVVQSAVNSGNGSTSVTATLSALTGTTNSVYMAGGNRANPFGGTAEAGWTENNDVGLASPNAGFSDIYRIGTTDNTPLTTISSDNWGCVAIEIT